MSRFSFLYLESFIVEPRSEDRQRRRIMGASFGRRCTRRCTFWPQGIRGQHDRYLQLDLFVQTLRAYNELRKIAISSPSEPGNFRSWHFVFREETTVKYNTRIIGLHTSFLSNEVATPQVVNIESFCWRIGAAIGYDRSRSDNTECDICDVWKKEFIWS